LIWINNIGISINNVIAFGDDYNDIGMIKECGIGIAMENSIAEYTVNDLMGKGMCFPYVTARSLSSASVVTGRKIKPRIPETNHIFCSVTLTLFL
jgi:magnesium-transporting ATPase (P-type)